MGDERPPRPMSPRAAREAHRLATQPEQKPASPVGGMLGCLIAGAWCFVFIYWLRLSGTALLLVGGLGFILVTLGLILVGVTVGEALTGRRHG